MGTAAVQARASSYRLHRACVGGRDGPKSLRGAHLQHQGYVCVGSLLTRHIHMLHQTRTHVAPLLCCAVVSTCMDVSLMIHSPTSLSIFLRCVIVSRLLGIWCYACMVVCSTFQNFRHTYYNNMMMAMTNMFFSQASSVSTSPSRSCN
jgi:hypothetical protein